MRRINKTFWLLPLFILIGMLPSSSCKASEKLLTYQLKDEINSFSWYDTQQAFAQAEEDSVDAVLIIMNTYGGRVKDADSIRSKILRSKIPVYVYIDNNAASAGAMISLACDSIFMTPSASIGAATVVGLDGAAMPDKYQSYQRATMRATAEAKGKIVDEDGEEVWRRDPLIAEAMVDEDLEIEGISEKGKVLTFTAEEALKYRYCDAITEDLATVYSRLNFSKKQVAAYEYSLSDRFIRFFVSSFLPVVLVIFLMVGLFSGLKMPGSISPFALVLLAGGLFFIPLYIFGLAAAWEVMIFGIGIILLFLEIFVIPGFGLTGISGILCIIGSLVLALVDNDVFDFEWVEVSSITTALNIVLGSIFVAIIIMIFIGKRLSTSDSPLFRLFGLHSALQEEESRVVEREGLISMKGKTGSVVSVLRPVGKIKIDGVIYDATTPLGMIECGENIVVVGYNMGKLVVEKGRSQS